MLKIIILLIISVSTIAGNWYVAVYGYDNAPEYGETSDSIETFSDCVAAGHPILESYPEKCVTDTGENFINDLARIPAPLPTESGLITEVPTETVVSLRKFASQDQKVTEDQIEFVSITPREWPDVCLGLANPEEMCIMMMISGYEVIVRVNDTTTVYRSDTDGAVVKKERVL